MSGGPAIRDVAATDAEAIAEIYAHYVSHTATTFDLEAPSATTWAERIAAADGRPWLVCELGGTLEGYAYAGRFRPKEAYGHTTETTIYLRAGSEGRGLGRLLLGALLDRVRADGYHRVIAGVTLPNDASVALHESLGFEPIGVFDEVGRKFDAWHDVGFWVLRL